MKAARFFGQNAVDPGVPDYQGWTGILSGCVPDARDLAIASANMGYDSSALFSGWNVAGKVMPWVLSSQCTLAAWRFAHSSLQAQAKPGDSYILGNSGHGSKYDTATAVDGGETLCFYDGMLYDTEQYELMRGWPAGVNVLYILDSCHSGGMDRDRLRAAIRSSPAFVKGAELLRPAPAKRSGDIPARILQFCACKASETAEDGPYNGAFTGCLLSIWDQFHSVGEPLTFQQWIYLTSRYMADNFPYQHPVLNVLGAGQEMLGLAV